VHPDLLPHIASWASPDFAAKLSRIISTSGVMKVTPNQVHLIADVKHEDTMHDDVKHDAEHIDPIALPIPHTHIARSSESTGNTMGKIMCIYFFMLGLVKDLRAIMNIDPKISDDEIVCKFGRTRNLKARTRAHVKTFSKLTATIQLHCHAHIDHQHLARAEDDVRKYFRANGMKLAYRTYEELVVIKPDYLETVKDLYQHIGNKYTCVNVVHVTHLAIAQ
jgi:hypothetical protein